MLKKFNDFVNEGIRDKMTPKSEDEINKGLRKLDLYFDRLNNKSFTHDEYNIGHELISDIMNLIPDEMMELEYADGTVEDFKTIPDFLIDYIDEQLKKKFTDFTERQIEQIWDGIWTGWYDRNE